MLEKWAPWKWAQPCHAAMPAHCSRRVGVRMSLACVFFSLKCKMQVRLRHFCLLIAEMLADIHGKGTSAAAESHTLRSEFPAVAVAAEDLAVVLSHIGRVQKFVAETWERKNPGHIQSEYRGKKVTIYKINFHVFFLWRKNFVEKNGTENDPFYPVLWRLVSGSDVWVVLWKKRWASLCQLSTPLLEFNFSIYEVQSDEALHEYYFLTNLFPL